MTNPIVATKYYNKIASYGVVIILAIGFIKILIGLFAGSDKISSLIAWVVFSGVVIIILLTIHKIYIRGRKLELNEQGINLGQKYLGPAQGISALGLGRPASFHNTELTIPWTDVRKIQIGMWRRWWARYLSPQDAFWSGEKIAKKEVVRDVLLNRYGHQVTRYYALISLDGPQVYGIGMNYNSYQEFLKILSQLQKQFLIDNELVKV